MPNLGGLGPSYCGFSAYERGGRWLLLGGQVPSIGRSGAPFWGCRPLPGESGAQFRLLMCPCHTFNVAIEGDDEDTEGGDVE